LPEDEMGFGYPHTCLGTSRKPRIGKIGKRE